MKIGFIGLGIMGWPMARNLLRAGYKVIALDKNPNVVDDFIGIGGMTAATPQQIAQEADIVITMLPDSPDVEHVVFADDGLLHGFMDGDLFIDMSTISPKTCIDIYNRLGQMNVSAIDAPVSGGSLGAESGMLSIMAGGDKKAFERAYPLFQILGKSILYLGDAGAGQTTKACNQIIIGVTLQAISEALTLAKKAGVSVERVRNALLGGFAQSRVLEHQGERIINKDFSPGFKLKLHRKDLAVSLRTAQELQVPLFCTALASQMMDAALAQGYAESDHSIISKLLSDGWESYE